MTGSLARYHARSPRYILDTQDNNLIRFSGAERLSWEEKTELKNVSLTGLSFTSARDLSPQLGEIIKIQFQVPLAETMACYAIVIRIQSIDESGMNEISVHFYKLDRLQRINLVQGLAQKIDTDLKANPKQKQSSWGSSQSFILMIFSAAIWLILLKLYWFDTV